MKNKTTLKTPLNLPRSSSRYFWSRVLQAFVEQKPFELNQTISPDSTELIQEGQRLNILEFLDWLRRTDRLPEEIPDKLIDAARKQRMQTQVRNRFFRSLMDSLADRAEGLEFSWLKGAAFFQDDLYPPGTRRMSDIDFLIQKNDVREWTNIIRDMGFKVHRSPGWILGDGFSRAVSSTHFYRDDGEQKVLLDVHWHLIDFPARRACGRWDFGMESIWSHARKNKLRPEHRLVYVADHAFSHGFQAWKSLSDLAFLKQKYEFDFDFIGAEIRRMGLGRIMPMTGEVYQSVLERPLLNTSQTSLNGENLSKRQQQFLGKALAGNVSKSDYLFSCMSELETWKEKFEFLRYIFFPPPSAMPLVATRPGILSKARLYGSRLFKVLGAGISHMVRFGMRRLFI